MSFFISIIKMSNKNGNNMPKAKTSIAETEKLQTDISKLKLVVTRLEQRLDEMEAKAIVSSSHY